MIKILKLIFYNSIIEIANLHIAFLILNISDYILIWAVFDLIIKLFLLFINITQLKKYLKEYKSLKKILYTFLFVFLIFLFYVIFLLCAFFIRIKVGIIDGENYGEAFLLLFKFEVFICFLALTFFSELIIIVIDKIKKLRHK